MQSSPAYQRPQLHLCNEYRMPLDSYLVSTVDLTSNRHYNDFTGFQYVSELSTKLSLYVLRSTPSLSSIPSGTHHLHRAVASVKEARGHQFSAGGPEQVERRRREYRGAAGAEMAHFVSILAVSLNFKFYCIVMNSASPNFDTAN